MSSSADRVEGPGGRQYHIGLAPGEVAPNVLLVGDPARADRVAGFFDEVRLQREHREFRAHTGTYRGLEITVLGTGIGCDNTEIAVLELLRCRPDATFVRAGSSGALQPGIELADLVVTTGCVRLESTSLGFVEEGFPAFAHHEVVLALASAAAELGLPHHLGITASSPGFYGWQGRVDQVVPSRFPDIAERLGRMRVANFEMESSTLTTLATLAGVRAGTVCAVFGSRVQNRFADEDVRSQGEERALRCALRAFEYLADMDREHGGSGFRLAPPGSA